MRRVATTAAILAAVVLVAGGCGDDGDDVADPADLEGEWDVSLVVGLVDTDPAAEVAFPTDATYRETWVFDDCDETGCTLHRPDGGFLFGDLDGVRVEHGDGTGLDGGSELRFLGEGEAAMPPPVDSGDAGPCDASAVQSWTVQLEVGVRDQVLAGSAFRTPEVITEDVAGVTCYGYDLTLGLSATPAR